MRKMDSCGLKICKFQAELFVQSLAETKCSSKIFIRRFMTSNLAKRMDKDGFLFDSITVSDAFDEIEMQFGPSEYGQIRFGREELYWMGYIYRYWSYISGKSSKQLFKYIKSEELRKLYLPYHSLDAEMAIERIKESKGLVEEDDIKRGVEIMRKIRAK